MVRTVESVLGRAMLYDSIHATTPTNCSIPNLSASTPCGSDVLNCEFRIDARLRYSAFRIPRSGQPSDPPRLARAHALREPIPGRSVGGAKVGAAGQIPRGAPTQSRRARGQCGANQTRGGKRARRLGQAALRSRGIGIRSKREPPATDRVDRRTPEHDGMMKRRSGFRPPSTE